jgi:hypothetical protein
LQFSSFDCFLRLNFCDVLRLFPLNFSLLKPKPFSVFLQLPCGNAPLAGFQRRPRAALLKPAAPLSLDCSPVHLKAYGKRHYEQLSDNQTAIRHGSRDFGPAL